MISGRFPSVPHGVLCALINFLFPDLITSNWKAQSFAENCDISKRSLLNYISKHDERSRFAVGYDDYFGVALSKVPHSYIVPYYPNDVDFKKIVTTLAPRHVVEVLQRVPKVLGNTSGSNEKYYAARADFLIRVMHALKRDLSEDDDLSLSKKDQKLVKEFWEANEERIRKVDAYDSKNGYDYDLSLMKEATCQLRFNGSRIDNELQPYWLLLAIDSELTEGLGGLNALEARCFVENFVPPRNNLLDVQVWENIERFTAGRIKEGETVWGALHDEAVLHTFYSLGRPREAGQKVCVPAGRAGLIISAVNATLNGQSSQAVRDMRAALRVESAQGQNRQRVFKGAIENFLFGLMLYNDRKATLTAKTLASFAKNDYSDSAYTSALPIFASMSVFNKTETDAVRRMRRFFDHTYDEAPRERSAYSGPRTSRDVGLNRSLFALVSANFHFCEPTQEDLVLIREDFEKSPLFEKMLESALSSEGGGALLSDELGMPSLLPSVKKVAPWEQALERILQACEESRQSADKNKKKPLKLERVAYYVDTDYLSYTPFVERSKDGVNWKIGRRIALKTFAEGNLDIMTAQDKAAAKFADVGWYGSSLRGAAATYALIGHPAVYDASDPDTHIQIVESPLKIEVKDTSEGYEITTNIDAKREKNPNDLIFIDTSQEGMIGVTTLTQQQQTLLQNLNDVRKLPKAAAGMLTKVLQFASENSIVQSSLLKDTGLLARQKADTRITLQFKPSVEVKGFYEAGAVVRPVPGARVVCTPAKGLSSLTVAVDNGNVQVERDLKAEKKNFDVLEAGLEKFNGCRFEPEAWLLDPSECLEMLLVLREDAALQKIVNIEWPEGEKFRVSSTRLDFSSLKLSVHSVGQWFELEGAISIDGRKKLKIGELLDRISNANGNFVSLGDNEYLALTDSLRKQLEALKDVAQGGADKKRISAFNGALVSALEEGGAQVTADKAFEEMRKKIEEAATLKPVVPAVLNAELRPYQIEGFKWMMRLAAWDAGAILADDMGLGKTVQTIAVLTARRTKGASLVVVPTAVLVNWQDEISRFAPGLKQVVLNNAENRAELLANVAKNGRGTVLLTTYGVMASEIEAIARVRWANAVFDEAHNIKNRQTKSFKAATQIQADFRIMLSGTPLQNHLTEIWSLFEIAVPGLLGSFTSFSERFVLPVERDGDRDQQRLLKRIISPFILRRTKTSVLEELPEKTEVTLRVALSEEEKALYETIRERAEASLSTGDINPVQALAVLTKLRQAACAPQLVDAKLPIASSKTAAFLRLAEELIEGRHRALVFSQFTSHLALIRKALDEKGVKYLYLDGSNTPAERAKLVDAFETGETPLFLISLKAGGTGLNLTAADYVIHLDPWWNPAIEEQASDRAYRIGQERPVTIYRLIAEGTVEEKILKLHGTKKSLADALLEGTEMSSRLGKKEILELLALARA